MKSRSDLNPPGGPRGLGGTPRWGIQLLWGVLLVGVVLGAARMRLETDVLGLLPQNLAEVKALQKHQRHFSDSRQLVVTVEAGDEQQAEEAAGRVAEAVRGLTNLVAKVFWQPPGLEGPGQNAIAELAGYLWLNQSPDRFQQLADRFNGSNLTARLERVRTGLSTSMSPDEILRGTRDPFGILELPVFRGSGGGGSGFVSEDGLFRLVLVEAAFDLGGYRECRDWMTAVVKRVEELRQEGGIGAGVRIGFTGRPAFVTEISTGMERDMSGSALGTLATIGALFWLVHRRVRPLIWLLGLLLAVLAGTTALGALFLGKLNVISIGFASILVGLAEDFGMIVYQETRSHPDLGLAELRRELTPGIFWSALTTAAAFLILNFSSLPGLGQMGSLIAIGIVLGAVVMLGIFLPAMVRLNGCELRREAGARGSWPGERGGAGFAGRWSAAITLVLAGVCGWILFREGIWFNRSPDVLKPRQSEAASVYAGLKERMNRSRDPLWVLVSGRDFSELNLRLGDLNTFLQSDPTAVAVPPRSISMPLDLWPNPTYAASNAMAASRVISGWEGIAAAAAAQGFGKESLELARQAMEYWKAWAVKPVNEWPHNEAAGWMIDRFVSRTPEGWVALVVVNHEWSPEQLRQLIGRWPEKFKASGIEPAGWDLLGASIFQLVLRELPMTVVPIGLLVVVSLWMAFKNLRDVLLSVVSLAFTGVALLALMTWSGRQWNLLNLMAIPLLLGMGVDFSIHMLLGLKRHGGDVGQVRAGVGRALLLAGLTTVVGFGSLSFSSNAGMAALGEVCAIGILMALLTAVYLLPGWWVLFSSPAKGGGQVPSQEK